MWESLFSCKSIFKRIDEFMNKTVRRKDKKFTMKPERNVSKVKLVAVLTGKWRQLQTGSGPESLTP